MIDTVEVSNREGILSGIIGFEVETTEGGIDDPVDLMILFLERVQDRSLIREGSLVEQSPGISNARRGSKFVHETIEFLRYQ